MWTLIIGIIIGGMGYYLDVVGKIQRFGVLYSAVANTTTSENTLMLSLKSFSKACVILGKTLKIRLTQYLRQNVKRKGRNYEVSYVVNGKLYIMIVCPLKIKPSIVLALDENLNDITDTIFMYYGPRYNFHGHPITPRDIGFKLIRLIMDNGIEKSFTENELLNFA